jgi:hypothetical protein
MSVGRKTKMEVSVSLYRATSDALNVTNLSNSPQAGRKTDHNLSAESMPQGLSETQIWTIYLLQGSE